eukprot:SAG31_NODE_35493_length_322_cov_0.991031_1_plen_63_part_10
MLSAWTPGQHHIPPESIAQIVSRGQQRNQSPEANCAEGCYHASHTQIILYLSLDGGALRWPLQ